MKKLRNLTRIQIVIIVVSVIAFGLLYQLGVIQYEAYRTITYVIPAGTYANPDALELPNRIDLTVGLKDILIIDNQDEVMHSFGPFVVAPHSKLTQRFNSPLEFEGVCTFHAEQTMILSVKPAPWTVF